MERHSKNNLHYITIQRGRIMNFQYLKSTYAKLPKSVYVIFFSRVVNSIGNFVYPFLTLLLTSKIGMGEEQVGLYLLTASISQIPGSLLGGKLSDVMGRKKIMITFMSLAALCFIPCAIFLDYPSTIMYVPWLLILASFFNSIVGPSSGAMMNDLTGPENRQAAFSMLYMGMNVGTAIGSIVAGFLFNNYIELLFLGDAATTLISIILLAKFVEETKPTEEDFEKIDNTRSDEQVESGGMFAALLKRPRLFIFAILNTVFSFIYAQTHFSMPLQANAIFGEDLGARYFGTFNMINCLEVIFLTTIITILTKKIRPLYNVTIAGIFYAVGFGMIYFVSNFWTFVLSTLIWTVGEIINATNIGVYLANHTPISHRGRFNAIISLITGTGGAISPYIMGGFIAKNGVGNVWPVIFILGLVSSLSMFILGFTERHQEPVEEKVTA
ncbi:MAG: major facilitator superfamily protein [Lachnospiraceae bacterium]|nr:major facilitator superfamily protein [Lachnospiraceae bacterium]